MSSAIKRRRPIFLNGLVLVLRHPGAVVWTYLFNLGIALVFSFALHARLSSILNHSMAAESLNAQFDLGTASALSHQLGYRVPSSGPAAYLGLPIYFLIYFILVPGTLFSFRIAAPGRIATLVSTGLAFFWRFVRIALLTLVVSVPVLGVLGALNGGWGDWVIEHEVGGDQLWYRLPGWILFLLVAALLRLYFDLVEVYTVQLDAHYRADGKTDRRVRKVLIPAARTLWRNFLRAYGMFAFLGLLGMAEILVTARAALHMLAQPRVWPAFLLLQAGLFLNLLTRYWQRGAETILAADMLLEFAFPPAAEREETEVAGNSESFVYGEIRRFPQEQAEPIAFPVKNEPPGESAE